MDDERNGLLFVVSAPSGAGKTTLCQEITRSVSNLQHSISYTTRFPRSGEINGRDYFFVDQRRFREMVEENRFLEWAEVHGNLYGTYRELVIEMINKGIDIILDIDCQGAIQIKRRYKEGIFIYILPPSFKVLKLRLMERRSDPPAEIEKRLKKAREEIQNYREYCYLIINDDFNRAIKELEAIIIAERIKRRRESLSSWIEENFIKSREVS